MVLSFLIALIACASLPWAASLTVSVDGQDLPVATFEERSATTDPVALELLGESFLSATLAKKQQEKAAASFRSPMMAHVAQLERDLPEVIRPFTVNLEKGRKAVRYTAAQSKALTDILAQLNTQSKTKWFKTVTKIVKGIIGLGVLIAGIAFPPAGLALGIGALAFSVGVSLWEAKMDGWTSEAAGAFVFNVAKAGVMTALGIEGIASAAEGMMDLICSTMVDTVGAAKDAEAFEKQLAAADRVGIPIKGNLNKGFNGASGAKTTTQLAAGLPKSGCTGACKAAETAIKETGKWLSCGVYQGSDMASEASMERDNRPFEEQLKDKYPEATVITHSEPMPPPREKGTQHWHDEEDGEE